MFAGFESHFLRDAALTQPQSDTPGGHFNDPRLNEFLLRFGGMSFNNGLYRVMTGGTLELAKAFVTQAFPSFSNTVIAFAYDWLGRVFALDSARLEGGLPAVVMLEPGTGHALEIPCNLVTFHENELINYREEALAAGFYKQWLARKGEEPKYNQCVGYKKPLFLSGKDVVENLEISDLDVYWSLSGQLIQKTRGLPPGARIDRVGLTD